MLSEVPVDDRELPLLFHARTSDFADVTVQATVTYRVADPALAADPARLLRSTRTAALARARPLDQIATLLAELAQQPALDLLARLPLAEALTTGIAAGPRGGRRPRSRDDARLTDIGVAVVSARVVAIRPEPELERALQTPTREAVQQEADRATYARRAQAVEQERAIAENELQNKIELARREQQLVEQHGANARRKAELDAAAELAARRARPSGSRSPTAAAERARLLAAAEAEKERVRAEAQGRRAYGRSAGRGRGGGGPLAAYRDLPPAVLQALALEELAGQLPEIGQLTVTPDVLTGPAGQARPTARR